MRCDGRIPAAASTLVTLMRNFIAEPFLIVPLMTSQIILSRFYLPPLLALHYLSFLHVLFSTE